MYLKLDPHSGEPIWRQIVEQVKFRVAAGRLVPGERLPSIRALASELKINPRTVVRAYEELEHLGLAVMRQGQGAFVAEGPPDATAATRRRVLTDAARRLLAEAARLGATPDEVLAIIRQTAEEMDHDA